MNVKGIILRNTSISYINLFWSNLLSFLLYPFIINQIGLEASGIWLLIASILGYFSLLDFGMNLAITKHIAEYQTKKDNYSILGTVNTSFFIFLCIGMITTIILIYFADTITLLFNIPNDLRAQTKVVIYIMSFSILLRFPCAVFTSILWGLQRYDISAIIGIIISIPRALFIILVLSKGGGLVSLAVIEMFVSILGGILSAIFAKRIFPRLTISPKYINKIFLDAMLKFSIPVFIMQLSALIILQTNQIIIGAFLSVGEIAYFMAAYNIYLFIRRIPEMALPSIFPIASTLHAMNNIGDLRKLFIKASKYITMIFLSLSIPVMLLGKPLLVNWVGEDFGSMDTILLILLIGLAFNVNHLVAVQILQGIGRIKRVLLLHIIWAISTLVISIILINQIGLMGAAFGNAIPLVILEYFYIKEILKVLMVSWKDYFRDYIAKTYSFIFFPFAIIYLVIRFYYPASLIQVVILIIMGSVSYLFMAALIGLDKEEKKDVRLTISSIKNRYINKKFHKYMEI